MKMLKIVKLFYILYSVYTVLVMLVSNYNFFDAVFGILAIWLVYFAFSVGFQKGTFMTKRLPKITSSKFFFSKIAEWKNIMYIVNLLVCVVCSIVATKFYTGKNLVQVISNLKSSTSNYNEYQQYFRKMNIAVFSIAKIPYILMLTFITAMLFWGIIGITLSGKKIRFVQWIYLLGVCISYIYFGVARGTNFEMYIVFILVVFCLLNRTSIKGNSRIANKINRKAIIVVFILGIAFIFVFRMVVQARGIKYGNIICTEISYNPEKMFSKSFPILTNILLSIFSYIGFGTFVIGRTITNMCDSFLEMFASILPGGFYLFFDTHLPDIVRNRIDIGVRWIPDYIRFIDWLGLPLFLIFIFILGKYMARRCSYNENNLLSNLIGFIIFMEMLSIPVGNFILNSTSNELVIFAIVLWNVKATVFKGKTNERKTFY